jgi:hypothetical protein
MTSEIVTYSRDHDLKKARQRQYAREYYHRNKKARQEYSRKYYAKKREKPEPEPVKSKGWFLVVPYSDSLLTNAGQLCRVAWRLLVTGPNEQE